LVVELPVELPAAPRAMTVAAPFAAISSGDRLVFERYRPRGGMHGDADPAWDLFERCLELPAAERPRDAATRAFLREIHAEACRAGAADLNVLRRGDEPLACCYNVRAGGTLLTLFTGEARDDRAGERQARSSACRNALPMLIDRMLQDSATRRDARWIPAREMGAPLYPSTQLCCSRFVIRRGQAAGRWMGRLAQQGDSVFQVS